MYIEQDCLGLLLLIPSLSYGSQYSPLKHLSTPHLTHTSIPLLKHPSTPSPHAHQYHSPQAPQYSFISYTPVSLSSSAMHPSTPHLTHTSISPQAPQYPSPHAHQHPSPQAPQYP